MRKLRHGIHEYGYVIFPITGGKYDPNAKFVIVDTNDGEDGFYLECLTYEEAERELRLHVTFFAAEGS